MVLDAVKQKRPTAWPQRLREDLEDTSLKASMTELLEALNQARQERDRAWAELRKRDMRIDVLSRHLLQARERMDALASRRRQRRQAAESSQLRLPLEDTP